MAAYCPPNKRVEPTNSQDSKFSDNLKFVNMNHLLLTSTSVESILKLVNAYSETDFNAVNVSTALHRLGQLLMNKGSKVSQNLQSDGRFKRLTQAFEAQVSSMSSWSLANCAWAFGLLQYENETMMNLLLRNSVMKLDNFKSQEICQLSRAFVSNINSAKRTAHFTRLVEKIARFFVARSREFNHTGLRHLSEALAHDEICGRLPSSLRIGVSETITKRLPHVVVTPKWKSDIKAFAEKIFPTEKKKTNAPIKKPNVRPSRRKRFTSLEEYASSLSLPAEMPKTPDNRESYVPRDTTVWKRVQKNKEANEERSNSTPIDQYSHKRAVSAPCKRLRFSPLSPSSPELFTNDSLIKKRFDQDPDKKTNSFIQSTPQTVQKPIPTFAATGKCGKEIFEVLETSSTEGVLGEDCGSKVSFGFGHSLRDEKEEFVSMDESILKSLEALMMDD
jgi:hypothetical protein